VRAAFERSARAVAGIPLTRRARGLRVLAALADDPGAEDFERTRARVTRICTEAEMRGEDPVSALEVEAAGFFGIDRG
jgi:hypothetical protein